MYPFHDENYYMYSQNPYVFYQKPPTRYYIQRTLNTALKGIQIANQMIPIVYQVKPLIDNTRNGIAIIKAMKNMNDIDVDVDEVVSKLTPIQSEDKDLFENMV